MVIRMADKKPLWEVMDDASSSTPLVKDGIGGGWSYARRCYAAMLRAIAYEVVPEEPKPGVFDDGYTCGAHDARMDLRAVLLNAAAEAEGEPHA
jgi:hypothetical protein